MSDRLRTSPYTCDDCVLLPSALGVRPDESVRLAEIQPRPSIVGLEDELACTQEK